LSKIISSDNVSFSYPGSRENAVNGVSFSAGTGEHIALVGPNGSGKTTLFQILNGTFRPASGKTLLDGKDIRSYPVLERACRVAYVPQGARISFPYTCFELVLMGLHPHQTFSPRSDWERSLPEGSCKRRITADAALFRAEEIMRKTGVWGFASKPANTLSGGELQRVLLARALLQIFPNTHETRPAETQAAASEKHVPKLLLLDEAFSELDIAARIAMMKLLNGMLKKRDFTIIGIHHDLHLANRFTSRIIALCRGSIAGDGPPDEIFTEDFFRRVFGVKSEIVPGKGFFFHDAAVPLTSGT
jgi:iron complex transport system ATP-binding protein